MCSNPLSVLALKSASTVDRNTPLHGEFMRVAGTRNPNGT